MFSKITFKSKNKNIETMVGMPFNKFEAIFSDSQI